VTPTSKARRLKQINEAHPRRGDATRAEGAATALATRKSDLAGVPGQFASRFWGENGNESLQRTKWLRWKQTAINLSLGKYRPVWTVSMPFRWTGRPIRPPANCLQLITKVISLETGGLDKHFTTKQRLNSLGRPTARRSTRNCNGRRQ